MLFETAVITAMKIILFLASAFFSPICLVDAPVDCPLGCYNCSAAGICLSCKPGYFSANLERHECEQKCPIGCVSCNSSSKCNICGIRYYKNSLGSCPPCSNNCINCSSSDKCDECDEGFFLHGTECRRCGQYCVTCLSQNMCDKCEDPYILTNGSCESSQNVTSGSGTQQSTMSKPYPSNEGTQQSTMSKPYPSNDGTQQSTMSKPYPSNDAKQECDTCLWYIPAVVFGLLLIYLIYIFVQMLRGGVNLKNEDEKSRFFYRFPVVGRIAKCIHPAKQECDTRTWYILLAVLCLLPFLLIIYPIYIFKQMLRDGVNLKNEDEKSRFFNRFPVVGRIAKCIHPVETVEPNSSFPLKDEKTEQEEDEDVNAEVIADQSMNSDALPEPDLTTTFTWIQESGGLHQNRDF